MARADASELSHCLDRMRAGDPQARDVFIQRCYEQLRKLTVKIWEDFGRLHAYEESSDVLQNATIRLLRRLRHFTPNSVQEFFALAAREIRRELCSLSRRHFGPHGDGTRQVPLNAPDTIAEDDSSHDPARLCCWTEMHERIQHLPVEERVVADLILYHGMTCGEAAEVLHWSPATVKRRWLAAREHSRDSEATT